LYRLERLAPVGCSTYTTWVLIAGFDRFATLAGGAGRARGEGLARDTLENPEALRPRAASLPTAESRAVWLATACIGTQQQRNQPHALGSCATASPSDRFQAKVASRASRM